MFATCLSPVRHQLVGVRQLPCSAGIRRIRKDMLLVNRAQERVGTYRLRICCGPIRYVTVTTHRAAIRTLPLTVLTSVEADPCPICVQCKKCRRTKGNGRSLIAPRPTRCAVRGIQRLVADFVVPQLGRRRLQPYIRRIQHEHLRVPQTHQLPRGVGEVRRRAVRVLASLRRPAHGLGQRLGLHPQADRIGHGLRRHRPAAQGRRGRGPAPLHPAPPKNAANLVGVVVLARHPKHGDRRNPLLSPIRRKGNRFGYFGVHVQRTKPGHQLVSRNDRD